MKTMTLQDFLTDEQINAAIKLYEAHGMDATSPICKQIIEPNMEAINAKLGQENDACYLAYAVVYVFLQSQQIREEGN